MKKLHLLISVFVCLCLISCGKERPQLITFHGGLELDASNISAMKKMNNDELKFVELVLAKVDTSTTGNSIMQLLSNPATIIMENEGQKFIWKFKTGEIEDQVAVYFDSQGNAMEVMFDGKERFVYRQKIRETTEEEQAIINKLDERTEE